MSVDKEIAYAKINLALHVRRRRDDGYHDLETIFAFCTDGDIVEAATADRVSLTIDGPFSGGLSTTDNLVLQAARSLSDGRGAAIRLTKNLPVAAGIGGGSADAAATLRLLSRMWNIDVDLSEIARELGADVPACIDALPVRGTGRGDDLVPVDPDVSGTPVLLVNPGIALHTASVFQAWDGVDRGALDDWRLGRNDLEPSARSLVPKITAILTWLTSRPGASMARMSGSGATCFALFDTIASRDAALAAAAAALPGYWALSSALR